eukprot:403370439
MSQNQRHQLFCKFSITPQLSNKENSNQRRLLTASTLKQSALLLVILISIQLQTTLAQNNSVSTAQRLISRVDPTTPPQGEGLTTILFDFELQDIEDIVEDKMHLAVKFYEFTQWSDPRLAYGNNTNVSAYFRNSRLDISSYRYNVWRPSLGYTEANKIENTTEKMYLYPNGTINYYRILTLTITCDFDYENIPSDKHNCHTDAYIQNEFSDTGYLKWRDYFTRRNMKYTTWELMMGFESEVDVRWKTEPTGYSSGVRIKFEFERAPEFMQKIFVFPSIIFVILAYLTFWIDSRKAPARVIFSITNILNAISLLVSTNNYVPQVQNKTWLQNFLIWNLIFTMIPIIQYSILNAALNSFKDHKAQIDQLINEVRAIAAGSKDPDDPDYILEQCRKEIAVKVRSTITGGDVLQIEDFQIDMNAISGGGAAALSEEKRRRKSRNMSTLRSIIGAIRVNNRNPSENGIKKALKLLNEYSQMKSFKKSLAYRMRKIVRKENSFFYGMAEILANNFDYIFRYLYAAAFLLLMAGQYLDQTTLSTGYSFMAASIVITVIFIFALSIIIIQYRKGFSNIDTGRAIAFYFKCKCCKTKQILENYD